jgi:hypothetical protein
VELVSRNASVELSIVASDFRLVATGMGRLSADVPPGIYQLVARAGPIIDRKLIRLDPGALYRDDAVAVAYPSPAPLPETSTSHEYHQIAAEVAAAEIARAEGPPSGLVIVVRDVRGQEGPPLDAGDIAGFGLLDESLRPVQGFEQGWKINAKDAVATWGGRLSPGGYALRTDPARFTGARRPITNRAIDQSIWLSSGWQTIVFLTTGPGGPQASAASIHITGLNLGWSRDETGVGHALELANLGLREGRSVLPDDLLNVLLGAKFVNPMLGIVGAHSLLLRPEPDSRLLDVVLNNLEDLVPGHPDVLALRWIAANRAADRSRADAAAARVPAGGVWWPPMLLPSYRGLIAMDASHRNAIADGSPAELAAANLLVQGLWTTWKPILTTDAIAADAVGAERPPPAGAHGVAVADLLPTLARKPSLIEGITRTDPAAARVAAYLGGLAALEGPIGLPRRFAELSPQEIGLATTLPVATVDRALAHIAAALPAVVGGSGGSGGSGGGLRGLGGIARVSLPVLAAGALLVAGVVGAVAWCAGTEGCPLAPVRPPASAPPTPAVTPEPRVTPSPSPQSTPIVLVYPPEVNFGQITIGGEPGRQPLTVLSPERVTLRFGLTENPDQRFAVEESCDWIATTSDLLGCTVVVEFTPRAEGQQRGVVSFQSDTDAEPHSVSLIGEGVLPFLRYPDRIEFNRVVIGVPLERELVIFATEPVSLDLGVIDGATDSFSVDRTCEWIRNDSGLFECSASVTFSPLGEGEQFATLGIFVVALDPLKIELSGVGVFQSGSSDVQPPQS